MHEKDNTVNDQPAVSQEIVVAQTSKAFLYKLHKAKTHNKGSRIINKKICREHQGVTPLVMCNVLRC